MRGFCLRLASEHDLWTLMQSVSVIAIQLHLSTNYTSTTQRRRAPGARRDRFLRRSSSYFLASSSTKQTAQCRWATHPCFSAFLHLLLQLRAFHQQHAHGLSASS
eukprot:COSAG04_NODE_13259_length_613_cov_1.204280_1_plen_104_part_10